VQQINAGTETQQETAEEELHFCKDRIKGKLLKINLTDIDFVKV
jgi:hypothetical protein